MTALDKLILRSPILSAEVVREICLERAVVRPSDLHDLARSHEALRAVLNNSKTSAEMTIENLNGRLQFVLNRLVDVLMEKHEISSELERTKEMLHKLQQECNQAAKQDSSRG